MGVDVEIICADVMDGLSRLAPGSAHCVVTSPPYYGLRDYGTATWAGGDSECGHRAPDDAGKTAKPTNGQRQHAGRFSGLACHKCGAMRTDNQIGLETTPAAYIGKIIRAFREVWRVLRDDGTLWLNLGDSYANVGKFGGSTGGMHAAGLHGGAGMGRGKRDYGSLKAKDLIGIPWLVAFALQGEGWYLRSDIIWSKPNCMPESVTDRPVRSHEYIFLLSKSRRYYYDHESIREPATYGDHARNEDSPVERPGQTLHTGLRKAGMSQRAIETRKEELLRHGVLPVDKQRGHGRRHAGFNDRWDLMTQEEQRAGGRSKRDVWSVNVCGSTERHYAMFPEKLIEPCILAGCPEGGVVLDPFCGTGTTMRVANRLGRGGIGIDIDPVACSIARRLCGQMWMGT